MNTHITSGIVSGVPTLGSHSAVSRLSNWGYSAKGFILEVCIKGEHPYYRTSQGTLSHRRDEACLLHNFEVARMVAEGLGNHLKAELNDLFVYIKAVEV